jgi:hypothetical protein
MSPCTNHADGRGNSYDRARRKRWLLSPEAGHGGDGQHVDCRWCGRQLTADTLEIDRWPVCGHAGGRYVQKNIVPACGECNRTRCSRRGAPCRVAVGQSFELFAWRPLRPAGVNQEVARGG